MLDVMDSSDSDTSIAKKPFKCTIKDCNASFSKNNKLTYHIRKHTGERPFACDESGCSKTYTNSSHLRRHKKISHGENESQSVICEYEGCGVVCANKYSLKKHHNNKHNSENYSYKCAECNQGFYKKRQLHQHVYLHTGEAPFSCDQCEAGFTSRRSLNRHKRSHRSYTCDCGEIFNRWSLLLCHKRHCKHPRFKCEICHKTFSQSGNLKNHKLTHVKQSKKDVFVCPYPDCKRFYFYKKNVKFHIDNFHKKINENKRFNCTYPKCSVILKTKQSLRMHLQRHFKWVPKKQRKPRRDKGIPKKSMISVLCGKDIATEHGEDIAAETAEEISVNGNMTDETLLKQCDIVLTRLNDQLPFGNIC